MSSMLAAVSVRGLSKKYVLLHDERQLYRTLREDLTRAFKSGFGLARVLLAEPKAHPVKREEFWALSDVSFDVQQGEALGIIGRNGAGKSTLLKVLSRVTHPSRGSVVVAGRLSSLLEVGTGFHPELTGRENIFLNGAILGMPRAEIRAKFDAIVDFAGVERFLDTPVKRYSSGMYVRLAFAIAAHVEPDVLIVDEVLAVGDMAFQRKCLGKIESLGSEGRTVLFVSHNMSTVTSLCRRALLLEGGRIACEGDVSDVVLAYYRQGNLSPARMDLENAQRAVGDSTARLLGAEVRGSDGAPATEVRIDQPVQIAMRFEVLEHPVAPLVPNFHFHTAAGVNAFLSCETHTQICDKGRYTSVCHIPANFLNEGAYFVGLGLSSFEQGVTVHFYEASGVSFNVFDPIVDVPTRPGWSGPMPGAVRPLLTWDTRRCD